MGGRANPARVIQASHRRDRSPLGGLAPPPPRRAADAPVQVGESLTRQDYTSFGSTCSVKSVKLRWLSGAHMR
jgi:hypothetical protein